MKVIGLSDCFPFLEPRTHRMRGFLDLVDLFRMVRPHRFRIHGLEHQNVISGQDVAATPPPTAPIHSTHPAHVDCRDR